MAKFDPQPTQNPLTDRQQIWITWLRCGHLLSNKIWFNPFRRFFSPYTWNMHPQTFECLHHFFSWFFPSPTGETVGRILTLNASYDAVLRKCEFRRRKCYNKGNSKDCVGVSQLPLNAPSVAFPIIHNSKLNPYNISEILVSDRGFSGSGYWTMSVKFFSDRPWLPRQRNLGQNWL